MSDQLAPIATFHAYDQDEIDRLAHSGGYMAILDNIDQSKEKNMENKIPSALKTIRLHCLDCSGGSYSEVTACPCTQCKLYPYRFGRSVNREKKTLTDKDRETIKERFARGKLLAGAGKE